MENEFSNLKRIKWFMHDFCAEHNISESIQLHLIEVEEIESQFTVTITLGRPGLFIGKAGRVIDEATERLTKWLEKPVKILLKEFNAWN